MTGKLTEIIEREEPFQHVEDFDSEEGVLNKRVRMDRGILTDEQYIASGAAMALDWVADMLVERIEMAANQYQRESAVGPSDADLMYSSYELHRTLVEIDEDRADEALETLRDAGL